MSTRAWYVIICIPRAGQEENTDLYLFLLISARERLNKNSSLLLRNILYEVTNHGTMNYKREINWKFNYSLIQLVERVTPL